MKSDNENANKRQMKGKVERGELLICNSSYISKAHVPKKVFETSP